MQEMSVTFSPTENEKKLQERRRSRILTESDQDFMEQLLRIWIPFCFPRQNPLTGTIEHKNKLSFFLLSYNLLL